MPLPDIEKLIEKWGIIGRKGGGQFYALCPFHDNKNTPSFNINLSTGAWTCYAFPSFEDGGCGSGNTIFSLGSKLFSIPYEQAVQESEKLAKVVTTDDIVAALLPNNSDSVNDTNVNSYEKDFGPLKRSYPRWFMERGFDKDSIDLFGIMGNPNDASISLPIYFRGVYLGYIKRLSPSAAQVAGYRYFYSKGFDKSKVLFGWDNLVNRQPAGVPLVRVAVAEGPLDTVWMQRWGIPTVAMLGSYLSEHQLKILRLAGVEEVDIANDNDKVGIESKEKLIQKLQPYFKLRSLVYPNNEKDPQELNSDYLASQHIFMEI
jgi:DNA primase